MNYSKANPKTFERYQVKYLGLETIEGKECKKFRTEFGKTPLLPWSWNNIMVKSVTQMGGKDFVIKATIIQDSSVDPKLFELPQGVTFKEM